MKSDCPKGGLTSAMRARMNRREADICLLASVASSTCSQVPERLMSSWLLSVQGVSW